jgi:uncharacterized membrane protein YraQ (UPF0718 family)
MLEIITGVARETWIILNDSAPYVLFGMFVAGLLKAYLPENFVARHLGKSGAGSVVKASLIGVPLPLCSCGVLPTALGLRKQGASKGAVTSFLISTPETGVDSIAVTYALLDPVMAVMRPVAAFVTAIAAGLAVNRLPEDPEEEARLDDSPLVSACGCSDTGCSDAGCSGPANTHEDHVQMDNEDMTLKPLHEHVHAFAAGHAGHDHGHSHTSCSCGHDHGHAAPQLGRLAPRSRLREGMNFAFIELSRDIGFWLLAGIVLAGVISYFLPPNFVAEHLGEGMFSMLLMLIIGVPMYVCATASTPIVAALALKGLSPGAALVFLLAGPATNAAGLTVLAKRLGRKATAVYVASIAVVSLALGMVVNQLYHVLGLSVADWVHQTSTEGISLLSVASSLVLVGLVVRAKLK